MIDLRLADLRNHLQIKRQEDRTVIWDPIRRSWVAYAPEEMVRQLLLQHLINRLNYPKSLIQVEKEIIMHHRRRRFDILLVDKTMKPHMLVECKAPQIQIRQEAFDQIARYNMAFSVPYLLVSNGKQTYCCHIDYLKKTYTFIPSVPTFHHLTNND